VVDRIPTPSTNSISRVSGSTNQTRPQTNAPPPSTNNNAVNARSVVSILQQLPPNQSLTAQATSSQALTSSEQSLLQRVNPSLTQQLQGNIVAQQTQANRVITGPAANYLNQPPELYLTKLTINASNTTANIEARLNAKTLTTITTQAFSSNQILALGQQNGQLLVTSNNPIQFNLQEKLQQAASQAIKNILPKQENVSQLQQFTSRLSQTLNQLPAALQVKLINPQTLQAINQLNQFIQTDNSLSQSGQIKQALNSSGVTFEAKLTPANTLVTQQLTQNIGAQQDIRIALDKLLTTLSIPTGPTPSSSLNQTDLQAVISTIVNTQNTNNPSLATSLDTTKPITATTVALFRLLGIQVPADNQAFKQLPKVIEQHLKKLIEQTQAKIQFNQLRSLGLDQPNSDNRTNLQQFQTELPLRFGEQVLPLQINIREQEIVKEHYQDEHNEDNEEQDNKKVRRWQVLLSFDLPNNEKLHSQLTIVESSISATLWAESSSLCNKAKNDITWLRDKLLANGLTVEDISCLQGKPQQKETSLDYNLVDIKT